MTIEKVFDKTDWALLRKQKTALLEAAAAENELLDGLLGFLDGGTGRRFGRRISGICGGGRVSTIRVSIEPSGYQAGRVCLKAVDGEGCAKLIVENILPGDACRERNELLERLVAGGECDEVTGEAIPAFAIEAAPLAPWVRRPGEPDGMRK
jgi:hypothetical protein